MSSSSESDLAIGFYTVEFSEALGWTGGYLVLNADARPLEFHCSLPVRPSRSHEILYGVTLRSYLIGEAIGRAVVGSAQMNARVICVDQPEAMALAAFSKAPVACLTSDPGGLASLPSGDGNAAAASPRILEKFGQRFACESRASERIDSALDAFKSLIDWDEPFDRIREAIREAQQGATARAA